MPLDLEGGMSEGDKTKINKELESEKLERFANMVNRDYVAAMKECVGFSVATNSLITD